MQELLYIPVRAQNQHRLPLPEAVVAAWNGNEFLSPLGGQDVDIVPPQMGRLVGEVTSVTFMGVHYEITLEDADGMEWTVHTTDAVGVGETVGIYLDPDAIHVMKRSDEPLAAEQEEQYLADQEEDNE